MIPEARSSRVASLAARFIDTRALTSTTPRIRTGLLLGSRGDDAGRQGNDHMPHPNGLPQVQHPGIRGVERGRTVDRLFRNVVHGWVTIADSSSRNQLLSRNITKCAPQPTVGHAMLLPLAAWTARVGNGMARSGHWHSAHPEGRRIHMLTF